MSLSEFFSLIGTWEIPNSGVVEEQKPAMQMMPRPPPKSNFTLTAQHVRDVKGMSPGTVMMTRIDTLGKVESFFVKKIHDRLQLKLSGSFPDSKVTKGFIMADL